MPDFSNIYPEIFYKLQPYILMICDQMESYYGNNVPNQEMLDQISENIYMDLMEMYPDLKEYARNYEKKDIAETTLAQVITRNPRFDGRGFRQNRGLMRDLFDILFFSEFFRRRRRFF